VTDGATEVGEFVPAFPLPVPLYIAQSRRIAVRAKRVRMILEARIVAGDVASCAAVHARVAKLRHDHLLDARLLCVNRLPFRIRLRQAARLLKVSRLVLLPLIEELIVENDPVHNQHD
jgi:hypothetical protein